MHPLRPRTLGEQGELQSRRAKLFTEPMAQPLRRHVAELRDRRGDVPDFDPSEAGVEARILVLHDSPGARPVDGGGSGFVSVDNDDAASESMWAARREAGLRHGVLHWNIVPWHLADGRRNPTARDLGDGADELAALLPLFGGNLSAIVLSGRSAQRSWQKVAARLGEAAALVPTWHAAPGAVVVEGRREELVRDLRHAAQLAGVPLFP